MSADENKALILRLYDTLNNGTMVEHVDDFFHEDFIGHFPGHPEAIKGREEFKDLLKDYLTAFPDLSEATEAIIAEGDLVAIRETYRATHKGPFSGVLPTGKGTYQNIAPTGKQIHLTGIDLYRIRDGKIAEQWIEQDLLGLLQQLDAVPHDTD